MLSDGRATPYLLRPQDASVNIQVNSTVWPSRLGQRPPSGGIKGHSMEVSMKIPRVLGAAAMTCGLFLLAAPSFAHHSFAAEFDGKNCRDFTGTLTKTRLAEPAPVLLHGRQGRQRQGGKLVVPDLRADHAEEKRHRPAGVHREHRQGSLGQGCLARNGKDHYAAAGTLKFSDGVLRQVGQLQD